MIISLIHKTFINLLSPHIRIVVYHKEYREIYVIRYFANVPNKYFNHLGINYRCDNTHI